MLRLKTVALLMKKEKSWFVWFQGKAISSNFGCAF